MHRYDQSKAYFITAQLTEISTTLAERFSDEQEGSGRISDRDMKKRAKERNEI